LKLIRDDVTPGRTIRDIDVIRYVRPEPLTRAPVAAVVRQVNVAGIAVADNGVVAIGNTRFAIGAIAVRTLGRSAVVTVGSAAGSGEVTGLTKIEERAILIDAAGIECLLAGAGCLAGAVLTQSVWARVDYDATTCGEITGLETVAGIAIIAARRVGIGGLITGQTGPTGLVTDRLAGTHTGVAGG
jgi:hypothetical protein